MTFPVPINPVAIGLGAFVGLLVGLTGMGGASLMTPLLILVAGVRPVVAVGTDIAYSVVSKLAGANVHVRQGTVDWKVTRRLAMGSLPGSLLGVFVLSRFKAQLSEGDLDRVVIHAVGIMLVVVSLVMLARVILPRLLPGKLPAIGMDAPHANLWLPVLGGVVGFLVGLTSVGSGSLIVPVLSLLTALPAARIVGTDITHAVLLLAVSAIGQSTLGTIDYAMTLSLLLGSVPGVIVGSKLCLRFPELPLRLALAVVLLISASRLL